MTELEKDLIDLLLWFIRRMPSGTKREIASKALVETIEKYEPERTKGIIK